MNMEGCEGWSEETWEEYEHDMWWMIQELGDEYYRLHEHEEEPEAEEEVLRSMEWKEQEEMARKKYFRRLEEKEKDYELNGQNNLSYIQEFRENTKDSEEEKLEDDAKSLKKMDVQRDLEEEDTPSHEMDMQENMESSKENDEQKRRNIIQVKEKENDDSESAKKAKKAKEDRDEEEGWMKESWKMRSIGNK